LRIAGFLLQFVTLLYRLIRASNCYAWFRVQSSVFFVKISNKRFDDKSFKARFLLSRSLIPFYSCFSAFSRICGFFSLLFLLTLISLQIKTLLTTTISCYSSTAVSYSYIASIMLSLFRLPILPGLYRVLFVFLYSYITGTMPGFICILV